MEYFIGIGAQKSGTTWLHDQLATHPEVCVPDGKELHYFDAFREESLLDFNGGNLRALNLRSAIHEGKTEAALAHLELMELPFKTDDQYVELLTRNATPGSRVAGEITPEYALLTSDGYRRINRLLDEPKALFIMRDPLERYWSMVRMATRDPKNFEKNFEGLIEQQGYRLRCDYGYTLRMMKQHFGRERSLVLFYEDLFSDYTIERTLSFLGVDETVKFDFGTRSLEGQKGKMPSVPSNVKKFLSGVYKDVQDLVEDGLPEAWGEASGSGPS